MSSKNGKANKISIKGSPFLWEDYKTGRLVVNDTLVLSFLQLRYNVFRQEIECKLDDKVVHISNPERIKMVELDGHSLLYRTYKTGDNFKNAYLEELHQGKCNVYNLYECQIQKANYNVQMDSGEKSDKFILNEYYCLQLPNLPPVKVKKKKGTILNLFSDQKKELKLYVKRNNLDITKNEGLIKMITYYESL